jgi:hypothetical protein
MVILCSFKQNGIEGYVVSWRVAASGLNRHSWFGAFDSQIFLDPLNQQLPQNKGEKYDR